MFKVEDKKFEFGLVNVSDAVYIKSLLESKERASSLEENAKIDKALTTVMFKYLRVEVETVMVDVDEASYNVYFENPFSVIEILARFTEVVAGFLQALPIFQKVSKGKSK